MPTRDLQGRDPRFLATGFCFAAALSFAAGMTDATGFLQAGDFVSFMSGNTTLLAIALGHGVVRHAAVLALLIACFVIGNAIGQMLVMRGQGRQWPVLLPVALLLGLAGLHPGSVGLLVSAVLAMGLVNAGLQRVAGLALGVSYVSGALSRFGLALGRRLMGERHRYWSMQGIPWLGLVCGGVLGTLAEAHLGAPAFWIPGGLVAVLALLSLAIPPEWQRDFTIGSAAPTPAAEGNRRSSTG